MDNRHQQPVNTEGDGRGALFVTIAVKQWVFTLSTIAVIGEAELEDRLVWVSINIYVLVTQILVLPPILAYAVAPLRTTKPRQATQDWLEHHNRGIVMTVSLIFGVWFSYKGISSLIVRNDSLFTHPGFSGADYGLCSIHYLQLAKNI